MPLCPSICRFCGLTVLLQTPKLLWGCLGICTSLTLPLGVVNDAGASPELLNKSPLLEGVTSAQDLHLEHQSGVRSVCCYFSLGS